MTQSTFKNKLTALSLATPSQLKKEVISEILDQEDSIQFVKELTEYGCASGAVPSLIYYHDTHAFYDNHYNEIEEIRNELQEIGGLKLPINTDLKNHFAWLAFEQTVYNIGLDLAFEC